VPSLRQVFRGAANADSGAKYETRLSRAHEVYAKSGLASIRRLPVPTAPIPGKYIHIIDRAMGPGRAHTLRSLVSRQGYDYMGVFGPNAGPDFQLDRYHGRAIAMEAKRTSEKSTSLPIIADDKKGSGLQFHQLDALATDYRDFGVVSVLCWQNGDQGMVLLPDKILETHTRFMSGGRKSIPVAEFVPYDVVTYPSHGDIEDWLYPVRLWLESNDAPSSSLSSSKVFKMIMYTFNAAARVITVGGKVVENISATRDALDAIAKTSADADEFIRRAKTLGSANEIN